MTTNKRQITKWWVILISSVVFILSPKSIFSEAEWSSKRAYIIEKSENNKASFQKKKAVKVKSKKGKWKWWKNLFGKKVKNKKKVKGDFPDPGLFFIVLISGLVYGILGAGNLLGFIVFILPALISLIGYLGFKDSDSDISRGFLIGSLIYYGIITVFVLGILIITSGI